LNDGSCRHADSVKARSTGAPRTRTDQLTKVSPTEDFDGTTYVSESTQEDQDVKSELIFSAPTPTGFMN